MNLWVAIQEDMAALEEAHDSMRRSGDAYARAEVEYQTAKAEAALRMKADGIPATIIQTCIKGECADELLSRLKAEAEYNADRELINVLKKRIDTNREQMAREWSR